MTHVSAINAFCIGLLLVALPRYAFGAGVGEDLYYPACNPVNSISAKFTSVEATYEAQAVCASPGSLKSSIVFQLTATGRYAKNIAKETIIVPAAQLSQPSHPYGKWEATYSCTNDPWLTGEDCQVISATPDTQLRDQSFAGLINRLRAVRPISAGLDSSTRTVLAARRDSDLKAERERALVSGGGSAKVFAAPTILAPIARQSFFAQTPIPIKLGLPQGWGAAGYYTVNIGRKDQTG